MNLEACADANGGWADDDLIHTVDSSGWYYIVVDSWHSDVYGPYTLNVDIVNPVAEECYGGDISDNCTDPEWIYFDWSDADSVDSPMVTNTSTDVPGMVYIYTVTAFNGVATHTFELPCDDVWYMWGLRWKPNDSLATFRFQVDDEPITAIWWDVSGGPDGEWDWDQANDSSDADWSATLDGGSHELTVLGGSSSGSEVWEHPALGFIIFTNDEAFVPPDPTTL
jgi:hypothetical protein